MTAEQASKIEQIAFKAKQAAAIVEALSPNAGWLRLQVKRPDAETYLNFDGPPPRWVFEPLLTLAKRELRLRSAQLKRVIRGEEV